MLVWDVVAFTQILQSAISRLSVNFPAHAKQMLFFAAHWACLSRINGREATLTWDQTKSQGPSMTDAQGQGGHSASAATAKGQQSEHIRCEWTLQMPLKLKRIQVPGILSSL